MLWLALAFVGGVAPALGVCPSELCDGWKRLVHCGGGCVMWCAVHCAAGGVWSVLCTAVALAELLDTPLMSEAGFGL